MIVTARRTETQGKTSRRGTAMANTLQKIWLQSSTDRPTSDAAAWKAHRAVTARAPLRPLGQWRVDLRRGARRCRFDGW